MSAPDVANGTFTASTVATVSFAARYQFIEIKNLDATNPVYYTTNGATPTVGGAGCYVAGPGERVMAANQGQFWWQGYGASDGTKTNPGTTVKMITIGTSGYEVAGTG
jgi:hypothetical protein